MSRPAACIEIADNQRIVRVPKRLVRTVVRGTLAAEGRQAGELSLAFVDDAAIAAVHAEFFDDPDPTDVITFNLSESDDERISGEIVVSAEHAAAEARRRGHDPQRELLLYVVHGLLHLCGWDDLRPADHRRMHRREDEILTGLGIGPVYSKKKKPK